MEMGYHLKEIERGKFGTFSKIREEFEEAQDAIDQNNPIMLLVELADMIGAIEAFAETQFNIMPEELNNMKEATKRAFLDGTRTSRD